MIQLSEALRNPKNEPIVMRANFGRRYSALLAALLMLSAAASLCAERPASQQPQPQTDDPAEIIRRAAANDEENDKRSRDYTYVEHQVSTQLDKHGTAKTTHSKTHEVFTLDGDEMDRLIAKDDKPLPEKDAKKEEERINKWMEKRQGESADEKKKRLERAEKDREEDRAFVKEVALAFNFAMLPHETVGGREAFVIDAAPKPGYQPKDRNAKILPKVKFRVWIDTQEYQAIKLQVTVIDTFSFGAFIFRLHPGSEFLLEQTRVNDEVWLPQHVAVKIDVRFALLKNYDGDEDITYSDYKKFRSEVKISPAKQ